ncbi:Mitochondrial magnesium exporter 1 [Durusdinium trenchii]|uniref:Mitochondrial magnesium exporter 1 n=1 Tax=Durusdinium trenchii TaxID=1381693 RepID=A0ABP0R001_9DINO
MSLATELVAGGLAGAVGIMATQPMDTIRIRLQSTSHALGRAPYAGIIDCCRSVLKTEGLRGLWKGYASPTFTVGGMNAILFLTYEATSRFLRDPSKKEDSLQTVFLAGCVAGSGSALINGPTELVKVLAQTNLKNKGTLSEEWHIAKTLVQEHGVLHPRGPLRGLGSRR